MASYGAGDFAMGGAFELSTMVLAQNGEIHVRSEAALRTLALLDFPLNLLAAFHVLPTRLRDAGYDLVARYRYSIFGKSAECRSPTPRFEARFLDYVPHDPPFVATS